MFQIQSKLYNYLSFHFTTAIKMKDPDHFVCLLGIKIRRINCVSSFHFLYNRKALGIASK
jgi:hypothetical protein